MADQAVIRVKASVRLLTPEEGGRTDPVGGRYRPNHNFFEADGRDMMIGQIDLPGGMELHPGQTITTTVSFVNGPGLEGQLCPGRQWRIQEGMKPIGIGTVIEVLPSG